MDFKKCPQCGENTLAEGYCNPCGYKGGRPRKEEAAPSASNNNRSDEIAWIAWVETAFDAMLRDGRNINDEYRKLWTGRKNAVIAQLRAVR